MNKRPNPELIDVENPEWTAETFARARPAREVLHEILPARLAAGMLEPKTRGRPRAAVTKVAVKLRLDPDLVEALRATGAGWQTRVNDALRATMKLSGRL